MRSCLTLENGNRGCPCTLVAVCGHLLSSEVKEFDSQCFPHDRQAHGDLMLGIVSSSPSSSSLIARELSDSSAKTTSGWAGDEGVSGAVGTVVGAGYPPSPL